MILHDQRSIHVLFVTNIPSPYRVDFFNLLGEKCHLTVCYERKSASDRDPAWKPKEEKSFFSCFSGNRSYSGSVSIGRGIIKKVLKGKKYDFVILTNYASPAIMQTMFYCIFHRIPYYIEYDGAVKKFSKSLTEKFREKVKQFFLKCAAGHFVTCKILNDYLQSIGVDEKMIFQYPFSSMSEADILKRPLSNTEKDAVRDILSMEKGPIIITVGQFIKRKGFDVLLQAIPLTKRPASYYFIGGEPTEEYCSIVRESGIDCVYFIPFLPKEKVLQFMSASDVFVIPTREDVWGLVVNEAMGQALPVIGTEKCTAVTEMVVPGENGKIIPADCPEKMAAAIDLLLDEENLIKQSENALDTAKKYTIEAMVEKHIEIFEKILARREL